jgi:hypothetical protein
MWFKHDGASPHYLRLVREYLDQTFSEQWIGRGGPVKWPAPSPDVRTLDFWLWEHLRTLTYSAPISDLEVLQKRVENACQESKVKPEIIDRLRISVQQKAEKYVEIHENNIEYLL